MGIGIKHLDFHTADGADPPHVSVYTVDEAGNPDQTIANFYILPGEQGIGMCEERAEAFVRSIIDFP